MNAHSLTKMSIATLGLLFVVGANVATAAQKQITSNPYDCFTDEGYGRKRSCSSSYEPKRAAIKNYDCFTDDGYGRKRPCSASNKR